MTTINNVIIEGLPMINKKYRVLHNLNTNTTIMDIKNIIFENYKIPQNIYYFIFGSKSPRDNDTLGEIHFEPECQLKIRFRAFMTQNK